MIDSRELRDALGHFATGVTIITTTDAEGQPVGVTVNSFASVSLDPPLVLWSLAKRSYSLPAFTQASGFAIHVLASNQQALSDRFARGAGDKFNGVDTAQGIDGIPLLPGCAAVFECSTAHQYDGGDHLILVGRVRKLHVDDRAPLLFYRGRYASPDKDETNILNLRTNSNTAPDKVAVAANA
ncbi:nitrilotriacetate monooxygenase [Parazoarcus communis]|uniref:Nitrilotriacetate monooxygenase n=1 Tax=Parazoarcus communis TaxID=41977 RepID=A0A2U8H8Q8_9RHOO|nr:flavin reductase family protein [Parazoarcus communis]AWI82094.1 nitrilotriacetate monooxygenase [Parazoarcus communis]